MFPALAVQSPSWTSAGSVERIAFAAPRSLNAPIGCSSSSFSQISAGASTFSRTSGVRTVTSRISSRAASISASGIGCTLRIMLQIQTPEPGNVHPASDQEVDDVHGDDPAGERHEGQELQPDHGPPAL